MRMVALRIHHVTMRELVMKPDFRFRLNSTIVPEIRIQRVCVNGQVSDDLEIAANVPDIGWIVVDDNSQLLDKDLPRFTLEYRNETEWSRTDPLLRQISKDKGWKIATPQELLDVLERTGHIRR
jgi:hypothetical protein